MRRTRITITLDQNTLSKVDSLIDHQKIRNRSHAIEFILNQFNKPKIKKAIILAGDTKALLPVNGKPILEYMIESLRQYSVTDIILSTGHQSKKIREHFGDGSKYGVSLRYIEETTPLQTGGSILMAKKHVENEPFLVIHGDVLTTVSFPDLIDYHDKEQSLVTVALTTFHEPTEYGQLKLHGTKLVRFYQHQIEKEEVKSNIVNCGIYVCEPGIFQYFPKSKKSFRFEDIIETLIAEKKVSGFVFEGQWFDVGNPRNYERAIRDFRTDPAG